MRVIIRYIHTRGLGREVHESSFNGDVITIGRGTDQAIQISDQRLALTHSKISRTSGKLSIHTVQDQRCTVNGNITRRAPLVIGDLVKIGNYQLRIQEGDNSADYVIDVMLDHDQVDPLRDRFLTRLRQVGVPSRQFAWLLFLLIIGFGLIVPVSGFFTGMESLRDSPLPDDRIWSSGDLDSTHAFLAEDCNYCHVQAFAQTRDKECLACHRDLKHHFSVETPGREAEIMDACGNCHQEHSSTGSITRSDQAVCVVCHADLQTAGFTTDRLRDSVDFSTNHPPFRLSLLHYVGDGQWRTERIDPQVDTLLESSNLLFPHDIHLAPEGIDSPDGPEVLSCVMCHETETGGVKMKTVTMESHCADCHPLSFDAGNPERVVPHGAPALMMRSLREYYALQFLDRYQSGAMAASGEVLDLPEARPARRPGKPPRAESISDLMLSRPVEGDVSVGQQAQRYIEARVAEAADNLFAKQVCTICHEISRAADQQTPWRVQPVRLNKSWMPLARFDHDAHKNMQCGDCHRAGDSAQASDVLMPDLGSCQSCHGGENARERIPSSCVSCHSFHLDSQQAWGSQSATLDLVQP